MVVISALQRHLVARKKYFQSFFYKMTSRVGVGVFFRFFELEIENNFLSPPDGTRELKLRPFDSESKTPSDRSNSLFSKKITPDSLFSFYHNGRKFTNGRLGFKIIPWIANKFFFPFYQFHRVKYSGQNIILDFFDFPLILQSPKQTQQGLCSKMTIFIKG